MSTSTNASQPKVAFISHWYSQAGAERCLYDTIRCLKNRGIESICLFPNQGSMVKAVQELGVPTTIVSYRWWAGNNIGIVKRFFRNVWSLMCLPRIIKAISDAQCNVVYTNTSMIWVGAVAARLMGIRHVWHVHEFAWTTFAFRWDMGEKVSFTMMKRLSDVVVFNSRTTWEMYESRSAGWTARLLYQGIETKDSLPDTAIKRGKLLTIGMVGYVAEHKRHMDVVDAVASRMEFKDGISVNFLGSEDPGYAKLLRERIDEFGLRENCKFLGMRDDTGSFYATMDAIIVASSNESFGRVTVEAMLHGIPVIAADRGANVELVQDGVTGLLFRAGDSGHLAEVIEKAISTPGLMDRLSKSARIYAQQRFGMDVMCNELVSLLYDVVGS